jgi:hypothetical protein
MPNNIADYEAPFPLARKDICVAADNARLTTTKTIVVGSDLQGGPEEKSKFVIKIFSGAMFEDAIALIETINQFKSWAEAKGVWNTPVQQPVKSLFVEWKKCLSGTAEANWDEIISRRVGPSTSPTFSLFKLCLSEFIVKKVIHNDDAYFVQKDYLMERTLPANMSFYDYYDFLQLYSSYMPWLLDVSQMIRMKNITATMEFEREAQALQLLWTTGELSSQDRVDILLRTMPERWTRQFRLSGGSHQSPENFVVKMMTIYDADDKRNRSNRYSSRSRPLIMRGGGRHGFGRGFSRDGSRDGNNNYNNRKPPYQSPTNQFQQRRDVNYSNNYNHNNYGQFQRQQPNYQSNSYNNNYNNNRYQNVNRGPPGAYRYGHDGRNQGRGRGRQNWNPPRQSSQQHFMQNDEVEQLHHIYDTAVDDPPNQEYYDAYEALPEELYWQQQVSQQELNGWNDIEEEFNAIEDVGYIFDNVIPDEDDQYVRCSSRGTPEQDWRYDSTQNCDYWL